MAKQRYIKKVKREPVIHTGDGEYSIPVRIFHKGMLDEKNYKKSELYRMAGEANDHIKTLEKQLATAHQDMENLQQSTDDKIEQIAVSREIVDERNGILKAQHLGWKIATAVLGFVCGILLYLLFT